jgi:GNAT superfamily N-acetyltransferase
MHAGNQPPAVALDDVARSVVDRSGLRFEVAHDEAARRASFRLRAEAASARGWVGPARDAYDDGAVHVVGWDGDDAVCGGRIVFPPGPLPTEQECGLVVEPAGAVADVGRMVVAGSHQQLGAGTFMALLAALYLQVRARGFDVACGMMAANVRMLTRFLGLRLEVLGPEREYWSELRAPVRFELDLNIPTLQARWSDGSAREDEDGVRAAEAEGVREREPGA